MKLFEHPITFLMIFVLISCRVENPNAEKVEFSLSEDKKEIVVSYGGRFACNLVSEGKIRPIKSASSQSLEERGKVDETVEIFNADGIEYVLKWTSKVPGGFSLNEEKFSFPEVDGRRIRLSSSARTTAGRESEDGKTVEKDPSKAD